VGAAIVSNMERSLSVPTATSFRNVPARLLEVNRKAMNEHRSRHPNPVAVMNLCVILLTLTLRLE
jgi:hypothetical protein